MIWHKELSIQGEKESADIVSAAILFHEFSSMIQGYTKDYAVLKNVLLFISTGLLWQKWPLLSSFATNNTATMFFWKCANGHKDWITVNGCANVTGSIKLPLLFIVNPRCFRGLNTYNLHNSKECVGIFSYWKRETQQKKSATKKLSKLFCSPWWNSTSLWW